MNSFPTISPGRLTALWLVLRSLAKLGAMATAEDLLLFARRSGLRSGGLPVLEGYRLAQLGCFISGEDLVRLTPLGCQALSLGTEEEPNREVLRLFVSVLLLRHPPQWVAYWQGDPSALEWIIPDRERKILRDAALYHSPSPDQDLEGWAWWDALRELPILEETVGYRKAIGDAAEELTFEYERQRLRREGFPQLATRVRWVARESPAYGFDVSSSCGLSFAGASPDRPLAIEVKGLALAANDGFPFYLTDHEWETAITLGDSYVFYLWDGVTPRPELVSVRKEPIILMSALVGKHLPVPAQCGERCGWKSTLVIVPRICSPSQQQVPPSARPQLQR